MKRFLSLSLTLTLILSCFAFAPVYSLAVGDDENPGGAPLDIMPISANIGKELFLHLGSPIALSDGDILPLDSNNPGLAPTLHKGRTLVPLRMISEHFGAVVDYDAAAKTALLTIGEQTASFPIGKNYFTLNGEKITLDTETILVSGRTFVPLRAICEQVLGLQVDYKDSVIFIAQNAKLTDELTATVKSKIGMFLEASSLSALKNALASNTNNANRNDVTFGAVNADVKESTSSDSAAPTPAPEMAATDGESGGAGYSSTNIQVEGVDEGDIIKTDGFYIYIVASNQLKIVKADAGKLTLVSSVSLGENAYVQEMYLDKNRVVIVGSRYERTDTEADKLRAAVDTIMPWGTFYSFVKVYDTTEITHPKLDRSFEIGGGVTASRKKGDYLYLVTNYGVWYATDDPRPLVRDGASEYRLPVSDIMVAQGGKSEQFLTLSAINVADNGEAAISETISGYGYVTYMSNNALYIAMPNYMDDGKQTLSIARFSIDGAKIGYKGSGTVEGDVNNQFSMDEYDGYFRLATTVWGEKRKNNLYVLDQNMDVCGSVLDFAPDESIYSARFMGARGYVVTYRQIDPLFVFDLSDPNNPKKVGELEIPGFSNYLHPISENVLLGVGQDTYEIYRRDKNGKEIVVGTRSGGLKLSLFDVSDAGRPKEIDSMILGDYGYSELLYNHKAAMFKADESLLALPVELSTGENWDNVFRGGLLISYKDNKLSERGRVAYDDPYKEGSDVLYTGQRLVYIGQTLYYLQDGLLRSFDLAGLNQIQSLKLTVQ